MRTRGFVDVGDGMVATVTSAPADRVLWIHGYALDSRIWDDLWARLPTWAHIGLDLPGHGASAPIPPGLDLVTLARQIGRFAVDADVRHLVGLSFGGMVALQVAIEFPSAFASLVLGAPGLGGGPHDRHAQARNLELSRLYRSRGAGPWLTDLWMTAPPDIFTGASAYPKLWQRLRAIVDEHTWAELGDPVGMLALTTRRQTAEQISTIEAAGLVIVGDDDMDAFRRCAELIRRSLVSARCVRLAATGHLALLERSADLAPMLDAHFRAARGARDAAAFADVSATTSRRSCYGRQG
jgi:2-succinyl-6-hydroxy-2,4-cyclohexadiene-1-carboxylate synthase